MELEEFVAQTLTQIVAGVNRANEQMAGGGVASPRLKATSGEKLGIVSSGTNNIVSVHFDVAVSEATTREGGGRVSVVGIGIGAGAGSESGSSSRIQFQVPLLLQSRATPRDEDAG